MVVNFTLNNIEQAARQVLTHIGKPGLVAFYGNMGAGKTTFISTLCKVLETEETASSPTYSIINQYQSPNGIIYHLDLYRLEDEEEALQAGVEECFYGEHWTFVEWPERTPGLLPRAFWKVEITLIDANTRTLNISFN
ncbi:tRNA (adenosine(37)-N6)-threonylcarbamoyltransferase complex ATPase subunit type 1 TsaE [Gynurincola endophyticus]|uniref:tRNA (adenosine(37)-N6)-threonylcarbamoyltransferase complex ATPase subunit type 1 TsaE n=1 Tax=Gynurincola endophyticus TaxID=2479004 RepID=UPI000F8D7CA5|nr:tRNA (adenosine(37)-N6)-threonylcarbamoyltransferase complex ATPase subunit type 1 TsaE [Gynurincola endophyticus]